MDASSALYGVTVIQALVGYVGWATYDHARFSWLDWAITFSAVIYALLGVLAHRLPRSAAVSGTALYVAYLGSLAYKNPAGMTGGLIFKVPVACLLMIALFSAFRPKRES